MKWVLLIGIGLLIAAAIFVGVTIMSVPEAYREAVIEAIKRDPKAPPPPLDPPREVALYVHSELTNSQFVDPLVCALRRVLSLRGRADIKD